MTKKQDENQQQNQPGLLTEDTSTVSGKDKKTGKEVTRPRQSDGKADESTEATDPNENKQEG